MTLALTQSVTAVGPNIPGSFLAVGGTPPYVYSVTPGGAGGTIDPSSGIYTAPASVPSNPALGFDTVVVTDAASATAASAIFVNTPILLFCDILQEELGLTSDRVYLWNQKINQPSDYGLYVAVSVPQVKVFGNVSRPSTDGTNTEQYVACMATVDVDIISRGPDARDRKEEVVLAVMSDYSQRQQNLNSFFIGRLPPSAKFIDLSQVDGDAIPYRYRISFNMQYATTKSKPASSFTSLAAAFVVTDVSKVFLDVIQGGSTTSNPVNVINAGGAFDNYTSIVSGGSVLDH